ncbi:DUF4956 domain-containing protein [Microbacterium protaetiae]|uniref:DUF4956 domain-containing protein n=1 Tax=Microbacterium protaetiae TaxID=2509458 RepID=A0A4P6EGM7_9MICO|nr:DUF4956 domain-containing protein [Microbacterium protaetiae]QAY60319.1 DUF4956 domain-containing protein [Microbacterium protaetiae]
MEQLAAVGLDLVAIALLAFAVYFPRHRRRDLAVAFVGINVGVLAVSIVLGSTTVGAGLGLGLFGVLSIIRLRSSEIEQSEIAYYFAALALGLITGLSGGVTWIGVVLMALILVALALIDSPALFRRYRDQRLILDRAYTDETALRAAIEETLGGRIHVVTVREVNLVSDTTVVDVRYALNKSGRADAASPDSHQLAQIAAGR